MLWTHVKTCTSPSVRTHGRVLTRYEAGSNWEGTFLAIEVVLSTQTGVYRPSVFRLVFGAAYFCGRLTVALIDLAYVLLYRQ